jgi:hypothetical protein
MVIAPYLILRRGPAAGDAARRISSVATAENWKASTIYSIWNSAKNSVLI